MVEVEYWSFRLRTDGGPGQDLHGTVVVTGGGPRFDVVIGHDEVQDVLRRCHPDLDPVLQMEGMLIDRILNPDHVVVIPGR